MKDQSFYQTINIFNERFTEDFKGNSGQTDKTILYHYKENGGKGSALNKGIELSSGSLIVTIDADCIVHQDAIENFVAHFADPRVMAAVGNVKVGNTTSVVATVQYLEFLDQKVGGYFA